MLERLREILIRDEGFMPKVYDDANGLFLSRGHTLEGHPTIGYGRALDVNGISRKEADYLLNNDIARVHGEASRHFEWFPGLCEARQIAILCMVFNLGVAGVKEFKKMVTAIADQRYGKAADEMLASEWATQVGTRAIDLSIMMRYGK